MPNKNLLLAIVGIVGLAPQLAIAGNTQTGSAKQMCPSTESDAQQLQCWQDEFHLQSAELKALLEAKKVNDATGGIGDNGETRQLSVPNVQLIYGASTKAMSAVLVYSDDRSLTVHPGEPVPGGFTVQSINSNPPSVVLVHAGKPLVLLMGGNGSSVQSSPNANTQDSSQQVIPPGSIVEPPGGIPGPAGMSGN